MRDNDIPREIRDLLGSLIEFERRLLENKRKCASGESIAKEMMENRNFGGWVDRINVIPGGIPGGCHTTLLVFIGSRDDVDKRILQAVEHILGPCKGITKYVLLWGVQWDSLAWQEHIGSFKGVTAVLKPFLADPTLLTI